MWIRTNKKLINLSSVVDVVIDENCKGEYCLKLYYWDESYLTLTSKDISVEDLLDLLWGDIKSNKIYSDYRHCIEE